MFIKVKRAGYDRAGQQFTSGLFLILMEPKTGSDKYPDRKDVCSDCGRSSAAHDEPLPDDVQAVNNTLHNAWRSIFMQRENNAEREANRDAAEIILDAQQRVTGCRYFRATHITYPIRAIVRHVAMTQYGHWMMGHARVRGHKLTLSGSYGADGLICDVPEAVYEQGVLLPEHLKEAWNKGGGWNSAGNEAPAMREWALANLKALRS